MNLSSSPATTILISADTGRARSFYEQTLGLPYRGTTEDGGPIFDLAGSAALALMEDPEMVPSGRTTLTFEVDDIEDAIQELGSRGIEFEDYDLPGLKTVDHVADLGDTKSAWFLDPDGNVLCLHEVL